MILKYVDKVYLTSLEYMVQIEAASTAECQEGVPSLCEQKDRIVLQVQAKTFQKKSQDHKLKSKIPGLVPALSTTSLVIICR